MMAMRSSLGSTQKWVPVDAAPAEAALVDAVVAADGVVD